jgi:transcriptional regulator with GAF, ATPase, and Fis domain
MKDDYAADLDALAALAGTPHAVEDVYAKALDALLEIIPYELAAVFELEGETLSVRTAVGPLANDAVRCHRLELSRFPTIRKALEQRRPVAVTAHAHSGEEGDPYDGVLNLPPGHACMVVPLYAGDQSLGIITLDRRECVAYEPAMVTLAGIYARVVSLAMMLARQTELLQRYRHQLKDHNRLMRSELGADGSACERTESSQSPVMRELSARARQVAATDAPVLIQGETGTGKEVLAQAVHSWSERSDGPFVKVNCASLPANLVESELFGHVKGAYSGAVRDRPGRFLTANGGTLLLDEVGELPLDAQAKLLRVLQEGTFEPAGSDRSCRVDVRLIAATHVKLPEAVASGRFREDLYYRLAVFPLTLPPLRERSEDVVTIAVHHLDEIARRTGGGPWILSEASKRRLRAHSWPGNVRELVNALERATIVRPEGTLQERDWAIGRGPSDAAPEAGLSSFREHERKYFEAVLAQTNGKLHGKSGAAELVGLKPTTLQSKLKKHGIELRSFRAGASAGRRERMAF